MRLVRRYCLGCAIYVFIYTEEGMPKNQQGDDGQEAIVEQSWRETGSEPYTLGLVKQRTNVPYPLHSYTIQWH